MGKKLLSSPLTGLKDSSAKSAEPLWQGTMSYKPRTSLGQKLLRIRERIIGSGERLLSWDDIDQEIAAKRGQIE